MWTRALRKERTQAIVDNLDRAIVLMQTKFQENRQDGFAKIIRDFLTYDDAVAVVNKLSSCTCCLKHCYNRPANLDSIRFEDCEIIWNNTDNNLQKSSKCAITENNSCKCNCRHFARWVCVAFHDHPRQKTSLKINGNI